MVPKQQTRCLRKHHNKITTPPCCNHRFPTHTPPGCVTGQRVTAVIAWGKRPVPFRTRKLRPTAPMVLHPGGCGRVGHRRTLFTAQAPTTTSGPDPFNPPTTPGPGFDRLNQRMFPKPSLTSRSPSRTLPHVLQLFPKRFRSSAGRWSAMSRKSGRLGNMCRPGTVVG